MSDFERASPKFVAPVSAKKLFDVAVIDPMPILSESGSKLIILSAIIYFVISLLTKAFKLSDIKIRY